MKPSETKRKIETDRGVGRCRSRKKLEEVVRGGHNKVVTQVVTSGHKWSEMTKLDFVFQREYLCRLHDRRRVLLELSARRVGPRLEQGHDGGGGADHARKHEGRDPILTQRIGHDSIAFEQLHLQQVGRVPKMSSLKFIIVSE